MGDRAGSSPVARTLKKPLYLREERRIYKGFSLSLILYEMFSDRKFTDAAYQSYVAGAGFCLTNW